MMVVKWCTNVPTSYTTRTHGVVPRRQIPLSPKMRLLPLVQSRSTSAPQYVLLSVSKIAVLRQGKKILKNLRRVVATQNPTVTRQKSEKRHHIRITRVTIEPNSKSQTSLTCAWIVVNKKHHVTLICTLTQALTYGVYSK